MVSHASYHISPFVNEGRTHLKNVLHERGTHLLYFALILLELLIAESVSSEKICIFEMTLNLVLVTSGTFVTCSPAQLVAVDDYVSLSDK